MQLIENHHNFQNKNNQVERIPEYIYSSMTTNRQIVEEHKIGVSKNVTLYLMPINIRNGHWVLMVIILNIKKLFIYKKLYLFV